MRRKYSAVVYSGGQRLRVGVTRLGKIVWASNPRCKHTRLTRIEALRAARWARRRKLNIRIQKFHPKPIGKRTLIKEEMDWALKGKAQIHYAQIRPMRSLDSFKYRRLPITADCSESTTGLYYAVGAPDPNGLGYNGSGFTGTLRGHLPDRAHAHELKVGDIIVYGRGSGSHVVVVYEAGYDPLVFSHGQESGPSLYRHSVENAAHGGYCTFHDGGLD